MLVVTRRPGESVFVGAARMKILAIEGGRVRIGFDAPADLKILRDDAIRTEARTDENGGARMPTIIVTADAVTDFNCD
jgi:carbon storage regulator CsrA